MPARRAGQFSAQAPQRRKEKKSSAAAPPRAIRCVYAPSAEAAGPPTSIKSRALAVYTTLYYDLTRILRDFEVLLDDWTYSGDGFIFGGAPRDHQAGLEPQDVDIALAPVTQEWRERIISALAAALAEARGVVSVNILTTFQRKGYPVRRLVLTHAKLSRDLKIDVVFGLQPILDFDVNGLIFTIREGRRQLCESLNPVFLGLPVDWGRLDYLIAHRQFNVVARPTDPREQATIQARIEKMRARGWTVLDV